MALPFVYDLTIWWLYIGITDPELENKNPVSLLGHDDYIKTNIDEYII